MPEVSDTEKLLRQRICPVLTDNIEIVQKLLPKNSDLIQRDFIIHEGKGLAAVLFYIDGLSNNQLMDEGVLRPLVIDSLLQDSLDTSEPCAKLRSPTPEDVQSRLLVNPEIKLVDSFKTALDGLLSGESLIFISGIEKAFLAGTKGWESRSSGDTSTEVVIRGPRDGFTENIRTNTGLIRRRIKDPMFRLESLQIGERTKTVINLAYIEGVVKEELVEEVLRRLNSIKVDAILESGYIQELIEDAPLSPFPTIGYTERPDAAAAAILEGRVIILTDTTPFVLQFLCIVSHGAHTWVGGLSPSNSSSNGGYWWSQLLCGG